MTDRRLLRVSRTSRRALLRSLGAGLSLAPFLPLLDPDRGAAQAASTPIKRLIVFFSSNGTIIERWRPTMQDGSLVLSEILAPLERHKAELLVIDGLDYAAVAKGEKDGHYGGMNAALTGSPPKIYDKTEGRSRPQSQSIDQHVGSVIGAGTKFRSLQCGIQVDTYADTVACLSYTTAAAPIFPQNDPYKIFADVFGGFMPPGGARDPALEQLLLDRRSVIDLVKADLAALTPKLASFEKQKMDAHLQAIREIETALTTGNGAAATDACRVPDKGTLIKISENDNIPKLGDLQARLLVAALSCDLTRVGTIQHGRAGANHRLSWLGPDFLADPDNGPNDSTSGIHGLAHNDAVATSRAKLAKIHAWYAGQVAALVDSLKAIPEGNGTMADTTLVVWMNELGTGGSHQVKDTPWVLVGNAGGALKTGKLLSFPRQPHNRLLLSIAAAMGAPVATFGDAALSAGGPLPLS